MYSMHTHLMSMKVIGYQISYRSIPIASYRSLLYFIVCHLMTYAVPIELIGNGKILSGHPPGHSRIPKGDRTNIHIVISSDESYMNLMLKHLPGKLPNHFTQEY